MKRLFLTLVLVGATASILAAGPPESTSIDPGAMEALEQMGTYLRTLRSFQIEVATTDEAVLTDGEKIQYAGQVSLLVQRPSRLRAEISNDLYERLFLFDGESFTLFAQRVGLYATMPAPPTIAELADTLERDHGFSVPLADLFRWGSPGWTTDGITSATIIGPSNVDGTTCEQYAFRQDEIDWQIWIQRGDHPLPRKLVITTKTDEARPQHTATYTWNLAPSFNDAAFLFAPPAGTMRVKLASTEGVNQEAK